MTRINAGIKPAILCDQHLLAEYREIIRVFDLYRKSKQKNKFSKIPTNFTLGTGHVLFFINKLQFIENRFKKLKNELIYRNYIPTINLDIEDIRLDSEYFQDWEPTENTKELLKNRIIERINSMKKITMYKKITDKTKYINFLNKQLENA